jgi:hypothetical protein
MPDQRNGSPGGRVTAAIECAQCGLRVFPVVPRGKKPLLSGWQRRATADVAVVEQTWASRPDANVGVLTGRGLLVVDADSPDAVDALRSLGLPHTTTVITRQGKHYYLTGRSRNRTALLPGVDIRGDGGYVVGPGSVHPSGAEYRWEIPPWEVKPLPVPPDLLALLARKRSASSASAVAGPIDDGTRKVTLFRMASSLRGRWGLGYEELLATLNAVNAHRCRPPLTRAKVEHIASRVASIYPSAPPWHIDPLSFAADPALRSRARFVLVALGRYCDADGVCWPGIRRLSSDTGMAKNTVECALRELVAQCHITVESRGAKSNRYRLLTNAARASASLTPQKGGSSVLDSRTPQRGVAP